MHTLSNIVVTFFGKGLTAQFEDRPDFVLTYDGMASNFADKVIRDCENVTDWGFCDNAEGHVEFSVSFIKRGTELHRSYEFRDGIYVATHD